jgi:hypothetical protein
MLRSAGRARAAILNVALAAKDAVTVQIYWHFGPRAGLLLVRY